MAASLRTLITGGTGVVGFAIAKRLGQFGHDVILNYAHDDGRAEHAVDQLRGYGIAASAIRADVADEKAVAVLFESVQKAGPLDVLVNAVGKFLFKPFLETTPLEWESIVQSNLTTIFLCSRQVLPQMRSHRRGSIVNIASMNAEVLRAKPNTLPYAIAKAGVVLVTKTLAATEGHYGIRVNAVAPGFVEATSYPPEDAARAIPLGRLARAEEIADAVAFLASDRASYITGAILNAHGGAFL